ncbi:MAG TPA: hypothetical protein VFP59_12180 [Candidatus Angelobacter sp.]|nr:hypothetical protein [Candidatus Angelobacter sp.]
MNEKQSKRSARSDNQQASADPPRCPGCNSPLNAIDYRGWGTMRFDPERRAYVDDDSPGNADVEYSCPNCSAKIDPEEILPKSPETPYR